MGEEITEPIYLGSLIRFNYVKKYLKRSDGGKLLDAGCGLEEFRSLTESRGYKYYGIDINHKEAKKRADICNLPFADAEFDCIICIDILEHIEDHNKAVQELKRVLRPDGMLIVHVPNRHQNHILIDNPSEQEDHIRKGYNPVDLHTLFYEFNKISIYATFDRIESIAWDIKYAANHGVQVKPENLINEEAWKNWTNYGWICILKD